jgi:hypothetical protein
MLVRASTLSFAHETAGAARIRHSLRPPVFEGEPCQDSGASRREIAEAWLIVGDARKGALPNQSTAAAFL